MLARQRILALAIGATTILVAACGGDDGGSGGAGATGAAGGTGGTGGTGGGENVCGDGSLGAAEGCDDGNVEDGDGCTGSCEVEPGFECDASGCSPICGDGLVVEGEGCDDGNTAAGDGCDDACAPEAGFDCMGEPSACTAVCGDGLIVDDEACDDGNTTDGDGCDASCIVETGFDCGTEQPSVCTGICGDSMIVGGEECDDGNLDIDDGCSDVCAIEMGWACDGEPSTCTPTCGDGLVNGSETCDDANLVSADGCDDTCQTELGYQCLGEPSVCTVFCGDGIVFGSEACDDGNSTAGDGCSDTCDIEAGFTCDGEPSICDPLFGDTCANVATITAGLNTVNWSAVGQDYITTTPACSASSTYNPDGPDVVMEFVATVTGEADFSIAKPSNQRWHLIVNDATCGDISNELVCVSEFTPTELTGTISITQGSSYYFYIVDSTSGSDPLSDPLQVTITETAEVCGDGVIVGSEACDDQNTADNDGCSSTCTIEPGFGCSGEPSVCTAVVADNCSSSYVLSQGSNSIPWFAVAQDYITTTPACSSSSTYDPDGPDLVFEYTATANGEIDFSIGKPGNQRWHLIVNDAACGDITNELLCLSEFTLPELAGTISAVAGTTYYFYLVDSTSGTGPLDNPILIDITENAEICGDGVVVGNEACDDGNTSGGDGCSSTCTVEAGYGDTCAFPITLDVGTQTIGWDATGQDYITTGPSCSSTAPDGPDLVMSYTATVNGQVAYSVSKPGSQRWHMVVSDGACGTLTPELACISEFTATEMGGLLDVTAGTTYYFYLVDSTSGTDPLDNPVTVTINEVEQTCFPGVGGMVGDTVTSFPSGFASTTEYYMAADSDPNGFVYVGGTTVLRRVPKGGGVAEDVHTTASLASSNLGYAMLSDGLDLYTLESSTSGTNGHLFRISTDGGMTFNIEDYVNLPVTPGDDFRAVARQGSQLFMATAEGTSSADTEIYSMPAGATVPASAVLEASISGELNCTGLAVDAVNYYLACGNGDRLIRVNRASNLVTLITDLADLSTTANAVYAHDLNSDGQADVLYFKGGTKEVFYACNPGGASSYVGTLATFGTVTSTSNYGLAFDAVGNVLYAYDQTPLDIIVIQ